MRYRVRYLWMLVLFVLLAGCREASSGDVIVVKAQRGAIPWSYVYAVTSDGAPSANDRSFGRIGYNPEWSADGQWVAFEDALNGSILAPYASAIYIMKADGSQRRRVTDSEGHDPAWSPDGLQIVYYAGLRIYTLDVSCFLQIDECQSEPALVAEGTSPDWAPDGTRIAYVSPRGQILIESLGVADQSLDLVPSMRTSREPKWSPDGTRIVFSSSQGGHNDIYTIHADSTSLINLTNGSGWNTQPEWSPDGKQITFVSNRGVSDRKIGLWDPVSPSVLYSMDADGAHLKRLSLRNDEFVLWYVWVTDHPANHEPV